MASRLAGRACPIVEVEKMAFAGFKTACFFVMGGRGAL